MPQAALPIETGGRVEGASPESMQHWCTSKIWCTDQINCVTLDFDTASDIIPFWPPPRIVSFQSIRLKDQCTASAVPLLPLYVWRDTLERPGMISKPWKIRSESPIFSIHSAEAAPDSLVAPQHPGERLALLALGNRLIKHAHIFIIKGPCSSSKSQFRNLIARYISSSLFFSGKTTRSVEALFPCLINWRWMRQTGSGRASPPPPSFTLHRAPSPCWYNIRHPLNQRAATPPASWRHNSFTLVKSAGDSRFAADWVQKIWKPFPRAGEQQNAGKCAFKALISFKEFKCRQPSVAPFHFPPLLLQSLQEHIKRISSSHHML